MAAERYQDFSRSKLAQRLRYYHGHHISCWNSKYISTRNSSWASQLKLCFSIIDHIERSNWDIWRAIFLCLVSDSWVQQYWRITSLSLNINHYKITHPLVNKILHQHEHYVCVFWMRDWEITYPYETIMEEHPQNTSWDFWVMHGSMENRLWYYFFQLWTCLAIVMSMKFSFG